MKIGRVIVALFVLLIVGGGVIGGVVVLDNTDSSPTLDDETTTETVSTQTTTVSEPFDTQPTTTTHQQTNDTIDTANSPWGEQVVIVAVTGSTQKRNVTRAVEAATRYWEQNPQYGDYTADFVVEPSATNPDILVEYTKNDTCTTGASGCAPQYEPHLEDRFRTETQVVQLEKRPITEENYRTLKLTAVHEFGHIIGLDHCDEPQWVMTYYTQAETCGGLKQYADADGKDVAWRDSTLSVYIDEDTIGPEKHERTMTQINHAIKYYNEPGDTSIPQNLTLTQAETKWNADIVISVRETQSVECSGDAAVCIDYSGRDYDRDGAFEYYTKGNVVLQPDLPVEQRGWYTGWALSQEITPGNTPPVFDDATYETVTGKWWE